MKKDIYSFGMCKMCGKARPLKNGRCKECKSDIEFNTLFGDIFGENND